MWNSTTDIAIVPVMHLSMVKKMSAFLLLLASLATLAAASVVNRLSNFDRKRL